MAAELWVAACLVAGFWLLVLELRHWWQPAPAAGTLRQRFQPAPRRPWLQLPPMQGLAALAGLAGGGLFGLVVGSVWAALVMGALSWAVASVQLPRWSRQRQRTRARKELQVALAQLVVALRSGHSLGTALLHWPGALTRALGPGKWVLVPHVRRLRAEIERGATPEEALSAMADRLGLDEVRTLAHVIRLCRRRGGDLGQVVLEAAEMLAEALEVRTQLQMLTAGKRAEGLVLTFLPPVMLLVLTVFNPTYALPLIQSNAGRLILAVALTLEAACFWASRSLLQGDL